MQNRKNGQPPGIDDAALGITDLEEQLRGPNGERHKKELLDRLDGRLAELAGRSRSGLSRTDFETTMRLFRALGAARDIIQLFPANRSGEALMEKTNGNG